MRTTTGSVSSNTPTAATKTYSPSVPLSVYRDLAAELQAAQAMLNALTAQNKQLVQENQLLQQEITKAVEFVLQLQKLVDSNAKTSYNQAEHSNSDLIRDKLPVTEARPKERVKSERSPVASTAMEIPLPIPEPVFIEEQEVNYYPHSEPEASPISSWWLTIVILLIILMGFGAGYLIVRPLFEQHSR